MNNCHNSRTDPFRTDPFIMSSLFFIRTAGVFCCWDYYESKTDVLIFGDVAGYRSFSQTILKAKTSKSNLHLSLLDGHPQSMRGVILPAKADKSSRPRLKLIERFVHFKGRPNMELIIFGNQRGYDYLSEMITRLAHSKDSDPSEHVHLDDLVDSVLVRRSVSLNIRAPLGHWNRRGLGEYSGLVYGKNLDRLPPGLEYMTKTKERYEAVTEKQSDFLKL
jgi:hypothetical protein